MFGVAFVVAWAFVVIATRNVTQIITFHAALVSSVWHYLRVVQDGNADRRKKLPLPSSSFFCGLAGNVMIDNQKARIHMCCCTSFCLNEVLRSWMEIPSALSVGFCSIAPAAWARPPVPSTEDCVPYIHIHFLCTHMRKLPGRHCIYRLSPPPLLYRILVKFPDFVCPHIIVFR